MSDKEKRKKAPQNRTFIGLSAWLVLILLASLMILAAVVTGVIKHPLSEWEQFATGEKLWLTQEAQQRERIAPLITQTSIASTQFYLATTSPAAVTPTPHP